MNKIFMVLLVMTYAFISNCGKKAGDKIPLDDLDDYDTRYVWVENLSFRDAPGLESSIIATFEYGEKVYFLNKLSADTTTVTIKCNEYTDYFAKIAREDGTVGWTFAGGLIEEVIEDSGEPVKIVVAYFPEKTEQSEVNKFLSYTSEQYFPKISGKLYAVYITNDEQRICTPVGNEDYPITSVEISKYLDSNYGYTQNPGYFFLMETEVPQFIEYSKEKTGLLLSLTEMYFGLEF